MNRINPQTAAAMQRRRDEGATVRQVATEFRVSPSSVRNHTGGHPSPPGRQAGGHQASDLDTARMFTMWTRGIPQRQIADQFGLSQSSVSERLATYTANTPQPVRDTILHRELAALDEVRRNSMSIMLDPARPANDRLNAGRAVIQGMERLARMLGLDAADERDERRIALEARHVDLLDQVLRSVLTALGIDPATDTVREVVHRQLTLIAGGAS